MLSSDAEKGRKEAVSGISQTDNYIQIVREQIRWKKARHLAAKEIWNHLCDQRDAYLASGMSEDEAVQKAVESMGDPVAVGTSLDRVHRPRPQYFMIVLTIILMIFGLAARRLGSGLIEAENSEANLYLTGTVAACSTFLAAYFIDFSIFRGWLAYREKKFFSRPHCPSLQEQARI